jgi:hypothetical protein
MGEAHHCGGHRVYKAGDHPLRADAVDVAVVWLALLLLILNQCAGLARTRARGPTAAALALIG